MLVTMVGVKTLILTWMVQNGDARNRERRAGEIMPVPQGTAESRSTNLGQTSLNALFRKTHLSWLVMAGKGRNHLRRRPAPPESLYHGMCALIPLNVHLAVLFLAGPWRANGETQH